MTIHPELSHLLERNRAAGGPALQDMALADARDAMRDMFLANGYPIRHPARVEEIPAAATGGQFTVTLYRPEQARDPLPAILYFHGGGYVLGDAATYDTHSRALAYLLGAAVVFVDYRLAPEHPFPAAVEDAQAAIDWLAEAASNLGLDPAKVVVMGESAGGNLAVNAALHAGRTGALSLRGATLIYPVTDVRPFAEGAAADRYPSVSRYDRGTNLEGDEMRWFMANYLPDPASIHRPENVLERHPDLGLMPPTRIITAECDPLRDMGLSFASSLIEAGVRTHATCLPGMLHSFMCHGGISGRALRHFFRIVEILAEDLDC